MAEDQQDADDEQQILGGQRSQQRRRVYGGYRRRKNCNIRIDELAKPRRWYMLSTWKEYGEVFEPDRMQAFKEKILEEFSMSPEETELYFSQLRRQARRSLRQKALERQMRQEKAQAKYDAYRIFRRMLRKAMEYAFRHPPPPIVSPMIRDISNTILEQLCEIHRAEMPKRDSNDKFSLFLTSIADWTAFMVGNIYYEVDVNEKVDIEKLREMDRLSRTTVTKDEEEIAFIEEGEGAEKEEERVIKVEKEEKQEREYDEEGEEEEEEEEEVVTDTEEYAGDTEYGEEETPYQELE